MNVIIIFCVAKNLKHCLTLITSRSFSLLDLFLATPTAQTAVPARNIKILEKKLWKIESWTTPETKRLEVLEHITRVMLIAKIANKSLVFAAAVCSLRRLFFFSIYQINRNTAAAHEVHRRTRVVVPQTGLNDKIPQFDHGSKNLLTCWVTWLWSSEVNNSI